MRVELTSYSPLDGGRDLRLSADVARTGDRLTLRYSLAGDVRDVSLPEPGEPERADELWRTTCFEAFVRSEGAGYFEFNVAPSRRWAAYRFDGYRSGMAPLLGVEPVVAVGRWAEGFELRVELALGAVPALASAGWTVGVSAVIEDAAGVSYWALRHAPGKPDFHHPDSFVLELPAP